MMNIFILNGRNPVFRQFRQMLPVLLLLCAITSFAFESFDFWRTIHQTRISDVVASEPVPMDSTLKITDFHPLFGQAEKGDRPHIPKSMLNLKLKGIVAGSGQLLSSAVIQAGGRGERVYRKGDSLPGGAILREIHDRYVIMEYQGLLQKLSFPEKTGNAPLRQSTTLPTTEITLPGEKEKKEVVR